MSGPALAQSSGVVSGTVSLPSPDGQAITVPGVTVTLTCADAQPTVEVTDDQGRFRFAGAPAGSCAIAAELQGFKAANRTVVVAANAPVDVALRLDADALHEEVTVTGSARAFDSTPIGVHVETFTAAMMENAPIASDRFQDALPLIPGVIRGPDGLLNIGGARSNQSGLKFNNADGTDPVTGEDAIDLPIDAVSSVEVKGAAFAPEFGLSSGAVTTVETHSGGDRWHVTINDVEPRLRIRDGALHGLESWTPRVTIGGPIVKNTLSFLQSTQLEYSQTRVYDLPPLESDVKVQSLESYSRADWTMSPTNHVSGSALVSPRKTTYAGLNPFNPQPVTPDVRKHVLFGTASDQIVVGDHGVLENVVSLKAFDVTIGPAVGNDAMRLAPEKNSGSYFNSTEGTSHRAEWLTAYSFSPIGPAHLIKVGAGVTSETVGGASTNAPVEIVRENGTLGSLTTFSGAGQVDLDRHAIKGFAQDTWTASSRLTVLYGVRNDYDSITGDVNVAPRASATYALTDDGRTILRGGFGYFYNPITMNVAVFDQLQQRTITQFEPDGVTPAGQIAYANVTRDLSTTRTINATAELDREVAKNLFVRVSAQQRRTTFEPILDVVGSSIVLESDGNSRYREGQITTRYQFHGQDQIVGSYTRSSAVGDLNDYNSFYGAIQTPVIRANQRGPLPWDAPNRWLFWSSISLPKQFAVFPVLDVRTGFPYSVVDEDRDFVGARNQAGRYPTFVSLDTQVTKRLRVFNHNATIGVKIFNITDHDNPRDFQNNLAASDFEHFYNSVGRTFRGKWVFEF
ncbi:MAG TPA: TonB-dependent receptor [Vicinamibacterales bacterium]|nr:TonB-dependent receptor [Vicinamibacterales bacterium]